MSDAAASPQAAGLESLPRTAQGWIPITHFDKGLFREGQPFLVQLTVAEAIGMPLVLGAHYMVDEEDGPFKFMGDWRYLDETRHLEPVAFQPMPAPSEWADIYRLEWPGAEAA